MTQESTTVRDCVSYRILKYHENFDGRGRWVKYTEVKKPRSAVKAIRRLERMGYDRDVSIRVERKEYR